jgi:hypothetical protein
MRRTLVASIAAIALSMAAVTSPYGNYTSPYYAPHLCYGYSCNSTCLGRAYVTMAIIRATRRAAVGHVLSVPYISFNSVSPSVCPFTFRFAT